MRFIDERPGTSRPASRAGRCHQPQARTSETMPTIIAERLAVLGRRRRETAVAVGGLLSVRLLAIGLLAVRGTVVRLPAVGVLVVRRLLASLD